MNHRTFRQFFIAVVVLAICSAFVLWSFNVLSELYNGPQAQYKHAIAAIGLLLVSKWNLTHLHQRETSNNLTLPHDRNSKGNFHEH